MAFPTSNFSVQGVPPYKLYDIVIMIINQIIININFRSTTVTVCRCINYLVLLRIEQDAQLSQRDPL